MVSIHTLQFIAICNNEQYNYIFEAVKEYNHTLHRRVPSSHKNNKKKHTFLCYREKGVTRFEFMRDKNINSTCISLVVNPKILLGDTSFCYTTIIDPLKVKEIETHLLSFLNSICSEVEFKPEKIIVFRIDYCCNFWLRNQDAADEYMLLLKRFRLKKLENQELFYHQTSHRYEARDGELIIYGSSYVFSIYEKRVQLQHYRNTTKDLNNEADYINSIGQMRIEYRALRASLYRKINKREFKNEQNELDFLSKDLKSPTERMINQLHSMYGKGDFYKKSQALKIIKNSDFGKTVQKEMIEMIKKVTKAKSLDPDLNGIDKEKLSRYINQYFNQIGLSPIVIPKRWNQSYFPNPAKYIEGTSSYLLRDTTEATPVMETEPDIERDRQRNNEVPEP